MKDITANEGHELVTELESSRIGSLQIDPSLSDENDMSSSGHEGGFGLRSSSIGEELDESSPSFLNFSKYPSEDTYHYGLCVATIEGLSCRLLQFRTTLFYFSSTFPCTLSWTPTSSTTARSSYCTIKFVFLEIAKSMETMSPIESLT